MAKHKRNGRANGAAPPDFRPIIDTVEQHFGKELADCIGELNEAVQVGEGQASFSVTLQIKRGKAGRFVATLTSRVRAPREPVTIDMHVDEDTGQLALGFDPAKHGTDDGEEEGEGAGVEA